MMINKCYYCGQEIREGSTMCPSCDRDQTEYRKLVYESDLHLIQDWKRPGSEI